VSCWLSPELFRSCTTGRPAGRLCGEERGDGDAFGGGVSAAGLSDGLKRLFMSISEENTLLFWVEYLSIMALDGGNGRSTANVLRMPCAGQG
jgi:hypothetical protein